MTRILVQRGSSGSSSNQNRPSTSVPVPGPLPSSASLQEQAVSSTPVAPAAKDDDSTEGPEIVVEDSAESSDICEGENKEKKIEDLSPRNLNPDLNQDSEKLVNNCEICVDDSVDSVMSKGSGEDAVTEGKSDATAGGSFQMVSRSLYPPPPPGPPPRSSSVNLNSWIYSSSDSNAKRIGSSRGGAGRPGVPSMSSPTGSRPSSPRSHCEGEGYNSADEQHTCYSSSYDDAEREHQFETEIRLVKGLEVRKMLEDGNCLFRAVADQVYGDSEQYDLVRQMCIDYMERERDHFSQFITEGFTTYCKRKRRNEVYGNNMEIQALSEMYNRPIHIYSYSTEPINIFHGSYNTETPPIRLSYHHGNHYNSLVDPRRLNIGAGLGFSSLQGDNIDKDQVKAAIKAQQDQQIDNALVAEGRFYSDLELTEQEIERMVIETSRAEYLSDNKFRQLLPHKESSTSRAEPSSSAARSPSGSETRQHEAGLEFGLPGSVQNDSMQIMLSMGFSYLQVIEAYSIFGDDVDSMVCYLIETSSSGRWKGKATK
ncbi:OTU domain-containing protein 5-B-like [Dorcoceras hygrometricum]|uniref:OTU domain-containing protein 5-B-like n=1 Tax=Dorcoceras hygrometricum TaxID=472368 RepID=A0A2Z7A7Z8_9LAMI|nr:OTU domain-containing protein 5-B-like [Dorcoceras hygrometricum]